MKMTSILFLAVALVLPLPALAGPAPDTDSDGIPDAVDNCVLIPQGAVPLPGVCDGDADGFGNACDGDFDQSNTVNPTDFTGTFIPAFMIGAPGITDMDCNGATNPTDFTGFFIPQFTAGVPGP